MNGFFAKHNNRMTRDGGRTVDGRQFEWETDAVLMKFATYLTTTDQPIHINP